MIEDNNTIELKNTFRKDEAKPDLKLEAEIKPCHDYIFCRLDPKQEITSGGIIIPDMAQNKQQEGMVIAVGPGKLCENGEVVPPNVQVGDRVLLPKWGGSEEDVHGVKYSVVKDTDILCRIVPVKVEGDA
jgi:chaperonin GroES